MTFPSWLAGRVLRPDDLGVLARLASSPAHPAPKGHDLTDWHAWLDTADRPELADVLDAAHATWTRWVDAEATRATMRRPGALGVLQTPDKPSHGRRQGENHG